MVSVFKLIQQAADEQWNKLDLSSHSLTELPPEIGQLSHLTSLTLRYNQLTTLPESLGQLSHLTALDLRYNQLTTLPESLGQLSHLTSLYLSDNQLTTLPESLGQLSNLKALGLSSNKLTTLPKSLGQLSRLTELYLSSNQLTTLPESLGQLSNLTSLYLSSNKLTTLPESLGQLSNLKALDLSSNQLTMLPDCPGQLSHLRELDLSSNKLTTLPESLGQLSHLTELYLSSNQLTTLPDCLGQLSNLTALTLSSNQLTTLPDCLGQLSNLTALDLSYNQLTTLPACLDQLSNLTRLDLSSNQLTTLPDSLGQLSNLTRIDLSSNRLTTLPDSLGQLSNLTRIDLRYNQLMTLPDSLGQLGNLTVLYLSSNQLTTLPDSLGQLSNLTVLYLSDNQLTTLPDSLGRLSNLTALYLSDNQFLQLPNAFKDLQKLEQLVLGGNPLSMPPEILRLGWGENTWNSGKPQAILDHYFTIRPPDYTQNLYEVKLLLVGEGGSGKSSLANKLIDPNYTLQPETTDTSTQGIDILQWEFTGRNGHLYQIKIWDFGGQEIYHQTHQFFLTQRSLYLLVADSRKENTDHYYWLKSTQLLSNNSPVLLIQNEKQDRTCNLDFKQLRGEFENLRDTYCVNLADNRGLETLTKAVQDALENLNPQGIQFPNKWMSVRYSLINDGRNYIKSDDYEVICRQHGITEETEMWQLSQFLHDLGICLHFQNDPILRHRLILKPNWGTAAVYKILDNVQVKQNWGHFSDADLDTIWVEQQYAHMRHELLQLMKEFKVCYEIPRRKGEYIAPHLLSPTTPPYDWDASHQLVLRYDYKSFMPKGILTRFIVEMHRKIENVSDPDKALVWKSGVILNTDYARAHVIEEYPKRQIVIQVSGNRRRELMTIIHHKFEDIHISFDDRLDYNTLIPCTCKTCKSNSDPFTFELDRLYQFIDQGRRKIQCYESGEEVDVRGLIDGVISLDRELLQDADRQIHYKKSRDPSESGNPAQNSTINVSVSVPVYNHNHQEQAMSNHEHYQGDNVAGDKVMGNKIQTGAVYGDAVAGDKTVYSQNLSQAAQEIKALLDQLAKDYPNEDEFIHAGRAVGAIKNNPTLKQRLINALKESGDMAFEKAIEAVTNNTVVAIVAAGIKGFATAEAQE